MVYRLLYIRDMKRGIHYCTHVNNFVLFYILKAKFPLLLHSIFSIILKTKLYVKLKTNTPINVY